VPDDPLLMRMPFELPATDSPRSGKAFAVGRLRIPVHLADPVQVLANLHTATERLNAISDSESSPSTIDLASIASLIPPTLAQVGMQLYTRSGLRHQLESISHGSVSYIAAEPVPAYCAGVKVVGMHTVAPLADGSGLNIGLISRGDMLDVSVCACPDNVPAVDDIATGIAHSVDILVAAAQKSPRGQGRSVVTEMTSQPRESFTRAVQLTGQMFQPAWMDRKGGSLAQLTGLQTLQPGRYHQHRQPCTVQGISRGR